jgi:hypothetical protein
MAALAEQMSRARSAMTTKCLGTKWLVTASAGLMLIGLYSQWRNVSERQERLSELIRDSGGSRADRIADLALQFPDQLLLTAFLTGFMVALALSQWIGKERS